MSPVKKKERLSPISRERFKSCVKDSKHSQRDIAAALFTTEAYLSRRLKEGMIDRDCFHKICEMLNISPEYLSGESDTATTMLASRRSKINGKDCIRDFMISRGFDEHFCDELTPEDLDNIEYHILYSIKHHGSVLGDAFDRLTEMENRIKELEKKDSEAKND